ncbi:unnamed protein product [Meloidogyne enterolobii]|uniref:Uncharacterized protein n=1 Tax=Meloidogyne enterolobii TaxID=390850 RepID=A0ACB1A469_MELEN
MPEFPTAAPPYQLRHSNSMQYTTTNINRPINGFINDCGIRRDNLF